MRPEVDASSLGAQSMRERATEIGGTCAVTRGPVRTAVRVTIPIIAGDNVPATQNPSAA